MPLLIGPLAVNELGASMSGRAIVHELDLARLELELDAQLRRIEHVLYGLERARCLRVHRFTA